MHRILKYRAHDHYELQMFSLNKGEEYLPSTLPTQGGAVHWSVTRSNSENALFIKVNFNCSIHLFNINRDQIDCKCW